MEQLIAFGLPGIPYGCAYGLMAVGLVLTYKASGVFNFAFGAQAYVSAVVLALAVRDGWPTWAGFVVAVLLLGPALGLVLDRLLFRFTRAGSPLVRLVPALGLLIATPSITQMAIGTSVQLLPPGLLLAPGRVYLHLAGVAVNGEELTTTIVTVAVVAALALVLRTGGLGLPMRAVVESPRLTELAGIRADRVGALAWILSSLLAGLSGTLLAPIYASVQATSFTALLVASIAAAAIGGFESLPFTLAGGVALGIAQELAGGYLPSGTILSSGFRPAFPFVVLALLLLGRRRLRQPAAGDPLAACAPPPGSLRPRPRLPVVTRGTRMFTGAVVAAFAVVALVVVPGNWTYALTDGLVLAIIFLSITLLTGLAGEISLCQATLAGVGAFCTGQLAMRLGTPVLAGVLAGTALSAVVGAILGLLALRLSGIALALLTLSFALLADNALFPYSWAGNGASGLTVPRPTLAGIDFAGNGAYFFLCLAVLGLVAGGMWLIERGGTGRSLVAVGSSERAAAAIGVDVRRLRVVAFALAAGIAGLGGGLYASLQGAISPNDFNYQLSLVFLVVVATVGVHSVAGAIEAGLAYTVLLQLLNTLPARYGTLVALVFGVAALGYVRHPEGVVAFSKRWVLDRAEQLARYLRRHGPGGPDASGAAPAPGRAPRWSLR